MNQKIKTNRTHRNSTRRMLAGLAALTVGGALVSGCAGDEETSQLAGTTSSTGGVIENEPSQVVRFCETMQAELEGTKLTGTCQSTLVDNCEHWLGTFSQPMIDAFVDCVEAGDGDAAECITEAALALEVTSSHETLATAYCEECAFGAPKCEDVFFFEVDGQDVGLGLVTLPFSAEVADEVRVECTDSWSCVADFHTCAVDVVKNRFEIEGVSGCVIDAILDQL